MEFSTGVFVPIAAGLPHEKLADFLVHFEHFIEVPMPEGGMHQPNGGLAEYAKMFKCFLVTHVLEFDLYHPNTISMPAKIMHRTKAVQLAH